MLRLLPMLLVLLTVPHRIAEEPPRDPLHPFAAPRFAAAVRVSGAVRARFALAAQAGACHFIDSLYGYNLLLSHFNSEQQLPIAQAAREGAKQGAQKVANLTTLPSAVPGSGIADCPAALQKLHAADDELVVLAEQVALGTSSR